jgi:hypothetical protein
MGVNMSMSAKDTPDDVEPTTEADTGLGADVSFPFDRMTVEQFRKRFPRARWSDSRQAWFVPGPTASRRFTQWLAELEAEADAFADAKGRDAFEFDPIASVYLELGRAGFRINTPYSRTVVEKLREIPYLRWDSELKLWHVPVGRTESSRIDGRKSKKQRVGTNQKNGRAAPKRGRVPNRKRSRKRGPQSGSGDAIL